MDEEIKDFTKPRPRVRFRIDDDVFECYPGLPLETLMDVADVGERLDVEALAKMGHGERRKALTEFFELILQPASLDVFVARLGDRDRPVDHEQFAGIVEYVFERYGLRPTEPSGGSSAGSASPAPGTPSADGSASPASTSEVFPRTAPSISSTT